MEVSSTYFSNVLQNEYVLESSHDSESFQEVLGDSGRVLNILESFGRFGALLEVLGGCGKSWEVFSVVGGYKLF
jgi:hypothetical protein